jgi:predicted nucleotidyltransferase
MLPTGTPYMASAYVTYRTRSWRNRARNPRVFGFVLHGTDTDRSDLDVLVDPLPGTTLFDLGGLQVELQELPVDLLTPGDLPPRSRERVLREAVAV